MEFDREPPVVGYPVKSGAVAGRRYPSGSSVSPVRPAPPRGGSTLAMSAPIQGSAPVQLGHGASRLLAGSKRV